MRLHSRGVLLTIVAVVAMSVVTAASASAALPEFKPVPTKKKLTSTSGQVTWHIVGSGVSFTCAGSTASGEVTGARTVGGLVLKYTGCLVEGGTGQKCEVNSGGAKKGEIVTKALKGELGTVKTSEAASGVGLFVVANENKVPRTWATIAGNACEPESVIGGSVAAEVATIGKKQVTNKLVFSKSANGVGEQIKTITLDSGVLEEPALSYLSVTLTTASTDELKFEEALEIT
jgi:hypothetical protein